MGIKNSTMKVTQGDLLSSIYDYQVKGLDGSTVPMSEFKDKVIVIFNSASKCGLTKNHIDQFNKLHEKFNSRGLEILGFPTYQFMSQEYNDVCEISSFNQTKNIKYKVFAPIEVNGENTDPLFKYLKFNCSSMHDSDGTLKNIGWNFGKFLVDRQGKVIDYFGPRRNPEEMEESIDKLLQ